MRLAVAGGTGTVGRHVVEVARERGHEPVILARSNGIDLVSGTGLETALPGVDAAIDLTSAAARRAATSREFFGTVTRNLLAAERSAGVTHHLELSIVGITEAPYGYYAGKLLQEQLIEAGPVPWTILRATQFHEFAAQIFGRVQVGPFVIVPRMLSQPVAAREVAQRLVTLAEHTPAGRVPDLAGPQVLRLADMTRRWAVAAAARGRVVEIPLPGAYGRAMRDGTLLAGPGADVGRQSFDTWLTALTPNKI